MLNRLTSSLDFHGEALVLRAERQRIIASNIANADTPGYVARDMDFAQALRQATGAASPAAPGMLAASVSTAVSAARPLATAVGHLSGSAWPGSRSTVELAYATPSQGAIDRNTVDMDRERASFADNAVRFEAGLRFINGNVRTMLSAITGQ